MIRSKMIFAGLLGLIMIGGFVSNAQAANYYSEETGVVYQNCPIVDGVITVDDDNGDCNFIAHAITYAPSGIDASNPTVIDIQPGTYYEYAGIKIIWKSNLHIKGAGMDQTTIIFNGIDGDNGGLSPFWMPNEVNNITISDLKIIDELPIDPDQALEHTIYYSSSETSGYFKLMNTEIDVTQRSWALLASGQNAEMVIENNVFKGGTRTFYYGDNTMSLTNNTFIDSRALVTNNSGKIIFTGNLFKGGSLQTSAIGYSNNIMKFIHNTFISGAYIKTDDGNYTLNSNIVNTINNIGVATFAGNYNYTTSGSPLTLP